MKEIIEYAFAKVLTDCVEFTFNIRLESWQCKSIGEVVIFSQILLNLYKINIIVFWGSGQIGLFKRN